MKKKLIILLGSWLITFCSINNSMAGVLTWQLTGEVEIVSSELESVFSVGDPVIYTFSIDTDTTDSNACDTTQGEYYDAVVNSEVTVGNYIATVENADVFANTNPNGGGHVVYLAGASGDGLPIGDNVTGQSGLIYRFDGVSASFRDDEGAMLPSDDIHIFIKNIISQTDSIIFEVWFAYDFFPETLLVGNIELIDVSCGTTDLDGDGFYDLCDNCPDIPNPEQIDSDGDLKGDDCDRYPDDSNNEARYEADLLRAQNELALAVEHLRLARSELDQCKTDFSQCQTDLTQCASNYAQCSGELSQCSDSLTKCEAYLTQSEVNYNQCITDLRTCETDLNLCLNPPEPEGPGRTCFDGLDNDSNGLTDCADPACAKKKGCR